MRIQGAVVHQPDGSPTWHKAQVFPATRSRLEIPRNHGQINMGRINTALIGQGAENGAYTFLSYAGKQRHVLEGARTEEQKGPKKVPRDLTDSSRDQRPF